MSQSSTEFLALAKRRLAASEFLFALSALVHFGLGLFTVGGYWHEITSPGTLLTFPMLYTAMGIYLWRLISYHLLLRGHDSFAIRAIIGGILSLFVVVLSLYKVVPQYLFFV